MQTPSLDGRRVRCINKFLFSLGGNAQDIQHYSSSTSVNVYETLAHFLVSFEIFLSLLTIDSIINSEAFCTVLNAILE